MYRIPVVNANDALDTAVRSLCVEIENKCWVSEHQLFSKLNMHVILGGLKSGGLMTGGLMSCGLKSGGLMSGGLTSYDHISP